MTTDEPRPAVLLRRVEELLDQAQLAVAPGQRRLEPVDALRPADGRDDGVGAAKSAHRLGLALELVLADVAEGDRRPRSGRASRWSTQTVPGAAAVCTRAAVLTASPATIPSPVAPSGDRHLAGHDADAHREVGHADVRAERGDRRRPGRGRRAPRAPRRPRARRGTPHTAITASPMNFSTVPP